MHINRVQRRVLVDLLFKVAVEVPAHVVDREPVCFLQPSTALRLGFRLNRRPRMPVFMRYSAQKNLNILDILKFCR